jgi:magnesium and cobalt transporter
VLPSKGERPAKQFRGNRNHLAIVIDEFGRVARLITVEPCWNKSSNRDSESSTSPRTRGDIF